MSQGTCVRLQTLNGQQPHKQTHMCTGCSVQTWDATVQKKREKECKKKECKMVGVDSALKKRCLGCVRMSAKTMDRRERGGKRRWFEGKSRREKATCSLVFHGSGG